MKQPTMICIEKEIASKIKSFKLTNRESYNDILNRLINKE